MYAYAVVSQLVIALVMVAVCIASPTLFDNLTQEDSLIEWLTAVLFLGGGIAAAIAARKARRRQAALLTTIGLVLLTIALLVVGFEEISWGQRIFKVETPEAFAQINMQQETNLHNISSGLAQKAAIMGGLLFGVFLPTLGLLSRRVRHAYEAGLQLKAPTPLIVVPCLLGYAACKPEWLLPTLTLGITFACCGACLARVIEDGRDRPRLWPEPLLLVAGMAVALLMKMGLDRVGQWTNGWMELGEMCLAGAAFMLALSTLAAPAPTTPGSPAPGSPGADGAPRHGE